MRNFAILVGMTLLLGIGSAGEVQAASGCRELTFHPERRVGGKCCFADGHQHSGSSGPGHASKQKALNAAINSWADFTVFEYGGSYGSFSRAVNKEINCSNSGGWSCSILATPCH